MQVLVTQAGSVGALYSQAGCRVGDSSPGLQGQSSVGMTPPQASRGPKPQPRRNAGTHSQAGCRVGDSYPGLQRQSSVGVTFW